MWTKIGVLLEGHKSPGLLGPSSRLLTLNSMASPHLFPPAPADRSSSSNISPLGHDIDLNQLLASAFAVLDQVLFAWLFIFNI